MTEPSSQSPADDERLPRCCPSHPDWSTLAAHLHDDFAEVDVSVLIRELHRAREAVASVGLDETEGLQTAELIARRQLMLFCGTEENARLYPQRRAPRHPADA